eukprot:CAMPEP_0182437862 /NCGR_PEP_ID=MMETSP1167-20130531/85331_1 /TAXON_ID=2988 /ORGANISM="Mallomonas Sp, Strain CCMP3275" /LENGTH=482 /DNA_ID=CAMNT_0024630927 /DNA_START=168 /DNA_END=1616 /DNA_ORIENTATION=-
MRNEIIAPSQANSPRMTQGIPLIGVGIDKVYLNEIVSLSEVYQTNLIPNDTKTIHSKSTYGHSIRFHRAVNDKDYVLQDIVRTSDEKNIDIHAYIRGGPRKSIFFHPKKVTAAVVTVGGLCPGLNNVIREIVHSLIHLYGVSKIYGIRGGFNGMNNKASKPIWLTLDNTQSCHYDGGTVLASSRGGFEIEMIIRFLKDYHINQLYIIGGDGSHRAAEKIADRCLVENMCITVVAIPKTIDNDVDLIDRSFGFQTSVEAAQKAIHSANVEAKCNIPNGIGIVKLMGRSSGFIAAHAVMASTDADLCLIPEIHVELEGPNGCLPFLMKRVQEKGYAVVVVAEGAGEELLGESAEVDAGGNRKLPAIGEYLADKLRYYFAQYGQVVTVKNIDPSYMIRSVPANASDAVYCMLLGQNAVHGAMAGYTNITVGVVNNHLVYIPIPLVVATSPRVLDVFGRTWDRVLSITRQPEYSPKSVYSNVGRKD